jgi:Lectin C-type domain/PEP-CTERM motif
MCGVKPVQQTTGEGNMKASHIGWLAAIGLLAVYSPTRLSADPISGPILNPATGHYYYLLQNSDWTNAQSQALSLGGNLATINDAAENAWAIQTFSDYGGEARNLWIGLSSGAAPGDNLNNFHWVDGDQSAYRNWASGEPNFPNEQYVLIIAPGVSAAGQWNNVPDVITAGYLGGPQALCYGVAEVIPEPSTIILLALGVASIVALSFVTRSSRIRMT